MKKTLLCLLFFFATQLQAASRSCDTLFILQDAGETQALLPVIEEYQHRKESFLILTGGTATEILANKPALKDHTISFSDLEVAEQIDKSWKRNEKIAEASLKIIQDEIKPSKVVSGVAFELQGQILETFKQKKIPTFAYWDNVNFEGTDLYFETAQKVAKIAETLLVPSKAFKNVYPKAVVVGKPSLDLYKKQLSGIQRSSVTAKLPFTLKSPVIVFVGGYGHAYDQALREFLTYAKDLTGYTILLAWHQKLEGQVEQQELKKHQLPHVYILERNVSTMEAVAVADHVICHQSSVGIEAAVGGKDVIYFIPQGQSYTNLLIERDGASLVSSYDELATALKTKRVAKTDPFETLKIPEQSVQLIYQRLHE